MSVCLFVCCMFVCMYACLYFMFVCMSDVYKECKHGTEMKDCVASNAAIIQDINDELKAEIVRSTPLSSPFLPVEPFFSP